MDFETLKKTKRRNIYLYKLHLSSAANIWRFIVRVNITVLQLLFCFAINIIMYLKCCSYIWSDSFTRKSFRKGIVAWLWNVFMQINYCIKDGIYRSLLLVTPVCFIRFQLQIWWYLIHDSFQLRHVSSLTVMKSLNSPCVLILLGKCWRSWLGNCF